MKNEKSVLVIEHKMDVIKSCDYLFDIGPEGGARGGRMLFEGNFIEISEL